MDDLTKLIRIDAGRQRIGTPTELSAPGAHTGTSRGYIEPDNTKWIYLDTVSGNNSNSGLTELLPKKDYANAAALVDGSTYTCIQCINQGATFTANITKPIQMKIGKTGSISQATSSVDLFTQKTSNAGNNNLYSVCYSESLGLFASCGAGGKIITSPDGNTWTSQTSGVSSQLNAICFSEYQGLFIAVGNSGVILTSSNGTSWTSRTSVHGSNSISSVCYSEYLNKFICGGSYELISYSSDGITWKLSDVTNLTGVDTVYGIANSNKLNKLVAVTGDGQIVYSENAATWTISSDINFASGLLSVLYSNDKFLATSAGGEIGYSSDGDIWTIDSATSLDGDEIYASCYSESLGKYVCGGLNGGIIYSSDGISWTDSGTPSFTTTIYGLCASNKLNIICGCGKVVSSVGKIAVTTAPTLSLTASICGFVTGELIYGAAITVLNCATNMIYSTYGLSVKNCRSPRIWIAANTATIKENLITSPLKRALQLSGTYATQDCLIVHLNTCPGEMKIVNASSTLFESIKDNYIGFGITATYQVVCLSGGFGVAAQNTNAGLSTACFITDPQFIDTTDYKPKRACLSYPIDSPLVGTSVYYMITSEIYRDTGCWSYDDSSIPYSYARSMYIRRPDGSGLHFYKYNTCADEQGETGEIDSYNNPDRQKEILQIQYQSVLTTEIEFVNYMESLIDMGVQVWLYPDIITSIADVTVSGVHAVGTFELNIDSHATITAGTILTFGTETYYVVAVNTPGAATKCVLNRVISTQIADDATCTPSSPTGSGEYQFLPENPREVYPQVPQETEIMSGLRMRFARKYVNS